MEAGGTGDDAKHADDFHNEVGITLSDDLAIPKLKHFSVVCCCTGLGRRYTALHKFTPTSLALTVVSV